MATRSAAKSTETLENRYSKNTDSIIFSRLADTCRKEGNISKAIELCTNGLKSHPDYITGRIILGRCFLEQQNLSAAVEEFIKVCTIDKRNQVAIKLIAEIYAQQGNDLQAGELYHLLNKLDPFNTSIKQLCSKFKSSDKTDLFEIIKIAPSEPFNADFHAYNDQPFAAVDQSMIYESTENLSSSYGEQLPETIQQQPFSTSPEKIIDDLNSGLEELNGDDFDKHMSTLFNDSPPEENSALSQAIPSITEKLDHTELFDSISGDISGNDITNRIDELFNEVTLQTKQSNSSVEELSLYNNEVSEIELIAPFEDNQTEPLNPDIHTITEEENEINYWNSSQENPTDNKLNTSIRENKTIELQTDDSFLDSESDDFVNSELIETMQFDRSFLDKFSADNQSGNDLVSDILTETPSTEPVPNQTNYQNLTGDDIFNSIDLISRTSEDFSQPKTEENNPDDFLSESDIDTIQQPLENKRFVTEESLVLDQIQHTQNQPPVDSFNISDFILTEDDIQQNDSITVVENSLVNLEVVEDGLIENSDLFFENHQQNETDPSISELITITENDNSLDNNLQQDLINPDSNNFETSNLLVEENFDTKATNADNQSDMFLEIEFSNIKAEENADPFADKELLVDELSDLSTNNPPVSLSDIPCDSLSESTQTYIENDSDSFTLFTDIADLKNTTDELNCGFPNGTPAENISIQKDSMELEEISIDINDNAVSEMDIAITESPLGLVSGDDVFNKIEMIFTSEQNELSTDKKPLGTEMIDQCEDNIYPVVNTQAMEDDSKESSTLEDLSISESDPSFFQLPQQDASQSDSSIVYPQETHDINPWAKFNDTIPNKENQASNDDTDDTKQLITGSDIEERLEQFFPSNDLLDGYSSDKLIPDNLEDVQSDSGDFYTINGESASESTEIDNFSGLEKVELQKKLETIPDGTDSFYQEWIDASRIEEHEEIITPAQSGKTREVFDTRSINVIDNKDKHDEVKEKPYSIPDHVLTPTLADIYFQQGQVDLAVQIYTRLLNQNPENDFLQEKLDEIKLLSEQGFIENVYNKDEPFQLKTQTPQNKTENSSTAKKRKTSIDTRPLAGVRIKKRNAGTGGNKSKSS